MNKSLAFVHNNQFIRVLSVAARPDHAQIQGLSCVAQGGFIILGCKTVLTHVT